MQPAIARVMSEDTDGYNYWNQGNLEYFGTTALHADVPVVMKLLTGVRTNENMRTIVCWVSAFEEKVPHGHLSDLINGLLDSETSVDFETVKPTFNALLKALNDNKIELNSFYFDNKERIDRLTWK